MYTSHITLGYYADVSSRYADVSSRLAEKLETKSDPQSLVFERSDPTSIRERGAWWRQRQAELLAVSEREEHSVIFPKLTRMHTPLCTHELSAPQPTAWRTVTASSSCRDSFHHTTTHDMAYRHRLFILPSFILSPTPHDTTTHYFHRRVARRISSAIFRSPPLSYIQFSC